MPLCIQQQLSKKGAAMSFRYRVNVIAALKEAGYNTSQIRKNKIFGEGTLQKFRDNEMVSWDILGKVCHLLECQPGDLIEYVDESPEEGTPETR